MNVGFLMFLVLYNHRIKGHCFLCDPSNHRELPMMLNFTLWYGSFEWKLVHLEAQGLLGSRNSETEEEKVGFNTVC